MGVITTIEARCKDCYKCVRSCPVKAIRVTSGHAEVVDDRCILDGRCTRICPQKAKKVEGGLDRARGLLRPGARVAASLAPSFVAAFPEARPGQVVAALRLLGFSFIQETSVAARFVAAGHRLLVEGGRGPWPIISSSCPAIVNLVEKHYPDMIRHIAPVVSPMIAHGRLLKRALGPDSAVVFIGPCVAKKGEAVDKHVKGAIDAVLTFDELREWLSREGLDPGAAESCGFDRIRDIREVHDVHGAHGDDVGTPIEIRIEMGSGAVYEAGDVPGPARTFPVGGGLVKTADLPSDLLEEDIAVVTGLEECMEFLEALQAGAPEGIRFVEMMACDGGCVDGPFICSDLSLFERRRRVLSYSAGEVVSSADEVVGDGASEETAEGGDADNAGRERRAGAAGPDVPGRRMILLPLMRAYSARKVDAPEPGGEDIRRILAATGKILPEDELNCGACGYDSCREKAVAVYQGMAEIEMCIPYMRKRAESMASVTFNLTPNGIIITDTDLRILDVNPVVERKLGMRRDEIKGRRLNEFLDAAAFEEALRAGRVITREIAYPERGMVTLQTVVFVEEQGMILGVITDITEERKQREKLSSVRRETLDRAQEVIDKQMRVAQEVAGLLGETTAETKVLLTRLMKLFQSEEGNGAER
ncbi:MAG: PAS domain-containing protein [Firmicutes bacterium]|nr:PAS domain-containing protein [Bacillota bacterium]